MANFPSPEELEAKAPKVWTLQNITRDERDYLNHLSKKLYGKTSHWQKMLKGEKAPMEEIMEDGTSRKYVGLHYSTVEEVKKIMEDLVKEDEEGEAKRALEAEALEQKALRDANEARELLMSKEVSTELKEYSEKYSEEDIEKMVKQNQENFGKDPMIEAALQEMVDEAQKLKLYEEQASEEKPHDPVKDILETVGD
jgi:hypothetical protein